MQRGVRQVVHVSIAVYGLKEYPFMARTLQWAQPVMSVVDQKVFHVVRDELGAFQGVEVPEFSDELVT